jgi:DNA-directed RNA polymerase sigma subunit (sigma70/sigma32)
MNTTTETQLIQNIKPIRMQVKLQNNLIKQRRESLGLGTKEMAEKIGITYDRYLRLENMRASPKGKHREWLESAEKVATYFHVLPEDLFPDVITAVKQPTTETVLDEEEIRALMSANYMQAVNPVEALEQKQLESSIDKALRGFSMRERIVLKGRLGLDGEVKTYQELAVLLKLSVERIRQIEHRLWELAAPGVLEEIMPGECLCKRFGKHWCPTHRAKPILHPNRALYIQKNQLAGRKL